ncbi:hypothetical protein K0U27_03940 [archaeon]|nr:hypothetical protein [archaeon]
MKKNKVQNIIIAAIAVLIIGGIVGYNYSAEQTKQKGFKFGNELAQIQQDVTELQIKFYSEKTKWDEGDISKEELLEYYEEHLDKFERVIHRYDQLETPELFESAVELFKISSQTQLESDVEFIKWIATGDESARIRSDSQIQEAYEYENLGLVEFQSAKKGIKSYDEDEKFSAPQTGVKQKVIQIFENMKNKCEQGFEDKARELGLQKIEVEIFNCINEAEKWKNEHMP